MAQPVQQQGAALNVARYRLANNMRTDRHVAVEGDPPDYLIFQDSCSPFRRIDVVDGGEPDFIARMMTVDDMERIAPQVATALAQDHLGTHFQDLDHSQLVDLVLTHLAERPQLLGVPQDAA